MIRGPDEKASWPPSVLHVAARSLPCQDGYALRLRGIVTAQRAQGGHVVVVTSPFYPGLRETLDDAAIDGVAHVRVRHPADDSGASTFTDRACRRAHRLRSGRASGGWPAHALDLLQESLLMRRLGSAVVAIAVREQAQIIHAHTPYRCALPATAAARRLGIPVVYEVRGLWEDSAVAEGRLRDSSIAYRFFRARDSQAMRRADAVVTLGENLAAEVARRGVPRERIFVARNGVDPGQLSAAKHQGGDTVRRLRELLPRGRVLGYVGSLRPVEGVDQMLRAVERLVASGGEAGALVVGAGPELEALRRLADSIGIGDRVVFTGRVPHGRIGAYYELIDVFVISRLSCRATNLVTPLKPLEAMALGRAVVMADLPALRELGEEGVTAAFFRAGDVEGLARCCRRLLADDEQRARLGRAARDWVRASRTWRQTLDVLPEAYDTARRNAARRRSGRRS